MLEEIEDYREVSKKMAAQADPLKIQQQMLVEWTEMRRENAGGLGRSVGCR